MKTAFGPEYGLFKSTEEQQLYPCPESELVSGIYEQHFKFLGQVLGKIIYESQLVDLPFAQFFLSKLLGKKNKFDDLQSFDRTLYKNMLLLKNYQGNVEDFGLTFTIANEGTHALYSPFNCHSQILFFFFLAFGETKIYPLVKHGEDILVTKENRLDYIFAVANYRLNHQIRKQSKSFLEGFQQLIPLIWVRMFNEKELQWLISGYGDNFDVEEFKRNVVYGNGFSETHPTIIHFWEVVSEMDGGQKRLLLKFVTSCPRSPLLGFKSYEPKIGIVQSEHGDEFLPTASTCMNLLKMPGYSHKHVLKEQLLKAIESESGFWLS